MMTRFVIIFLLLLNGSSVLAQIETVTWQNCLGTKDGMNDTKTVERSENGYFFGIQLLKDGPGVTNYHGSADVWVVETDFTGNIIWEKCFGGSKGEGCHKIINIDDTSYYLLNYSDSDDGDVQNGRAGNFWIVKINSSGDIIWENSYGGCLLGEEVRDAILMPDNGLICMGRISSTGGDITTHYGNMDIWLFRIDSSGNLLWETTYGNQGVDEAIKIKLTSKSTILMIGCHDTSGGMIDCPEPYGFYADVWVVEMDLKGNMLNHWCYGGNYWDQGWDIIETDDGYIFAATTSSSDGQVEGFHGFGGPDVPDDIWVVKIDFNGNILWQKCLGGYSTEWPIYITETSDSGFIIVGNTLSHDGDVTGNHTTEWNELDIWVVKLSYDGQLLWEHCFGGLGTDRFWGIHSVLKKDDYNFVIGANSNYASGDVTCDLFLTDETANAWLFEINDCNYYTPGIPSGLSGPDTLCTVANPESIYSIDSVQWATAYEWRIQPDSAGSVLSDSVTIQVTWNPIFEGQVMVQARSFNDCGYSAWSEAFITQVYTCLGTGEYNINEYSLIINPNPAHEKVTISIIGEIRKEQIEISLMNILGNEIKRGLLSEGEESTVIDISELPAGIYFVAIMDEGKRVTSGKMVVAR